MFFFGIFLVTFTQEHGDEENSDEFEMTIAALSIGEARHTKSGKMLLFQIHHKLRKVKPRMQFAIFVTKYSVNAE